MKYKVTTIVTHHYKSTYMIDAKSEREAVQKLIDLDPGTELLNQEAYGEPDFPDTMDGFIVETF